jgi:fructose-bisphosphate aldolase class II
MLIPTAEILNEARKYRYGVVAPNVFEINSVKAVFEVADELRSPVILGCSDKLDLESIAEATKFYSRRYPDVVASLNLDHGKSFDSAVRAIKAGFTSVMVDRSTLPFEDNVRETVEIVKMAHAVGVSVEAELGHVGQGASYDKDRDSGLTDVDEAVRFVEKTNVDCLAVAIGTAHGQYIGVPKLDFDRLINLREKVPVPLVLHGGSSTGDENLKKAVELGISKVNISTDLKIKGAEYIKKYVSDGSCNNLFSIIDEGIKGWKEMLIHYIKLFGSEGKV